MNSNCLGDIMNKENIKKGVASVVLMSTLLTGCSFKGNGNTKHEITRNSDYISVAIILGDNTATIMDIGYYYVEGGYLYVVMDDNSTVAFSNAVIVEGFADYAEITKLARSMVGSGGEINYYDYNDLHSKIKRKTY